MQKPDIRNCSDEEMKQFLLSVNEKPFRAKQIHEWLWKKNVHSFEEMINISKSLMEQLKTKLMQHVLFWNRFNVSKMEDPFCKAGSP